MDTHMNMCTYMYFLKSRKVKVEMAVTKSTTTRAVGYRDDLVPRPSLVLCYSEIGKAWLIL